MWVEKIKGGNTNLKNSKEQHYGPKKYDVNLQIAKLYDSTKKHKKVHVSSNFVQHYQTKR